MASSKCKDLFPGRNFSQTQQYRVFDNCDDHSLLNIEFVDVSSILFSESRNERKENGKGVYFSLSLNLNDTSQPAIEFSIRILVLLSVKYAHKPLSSHSREVNTITYEVFL